MYFNGQVPLFTTCLHIIIVDWSCFDGQRTFDPSTPTISVALIFNQNQGICLTSVGYAAYGLG